MIVTFYSFKGGVGRSMAMVNVGEILADLGYDVTLCDWDLEAPGLEHYLTSDHERAVEYRAFPGIMDLLLEYKKTLATPPKAQSSSTDPETSNTHKQLGKVLVRRPSSYAIPMPSQSKRKSSLRLLTAGCRAADSNEKYSRAVQTFDWTDFYESWAGGSYLEFFRKDLEEEGNIVLVDSRTGVTEHGGICTHHLADLVVLLTAANDLNLDGTQWMANALRDPKLEELRGGRPLQILPVAARIEQTAEKDELVGFRSRFSQMFRDYIPESIGDTENFLYEGEIPYVPFYSFSERVAAREPDEQRERGLYDAYRRLALAIVRWGISTKKLMDRLGLADRVYEPRADVEKALSMHKVWLETNGREGACANLAQAKLSRVNLSGVSLHNAILTGTDLHGADLSKAELSGTNLSAADLSGANLQEADLKEADLQGTNLQRAALSHAALRHANLKDADLTGVTGLLAEQLGRANVLGATLPQDIHKFEALTTINEASKNAKRIFLAMLLVCAYSVLTVFSTTDARLLTNSASSPLPIIGTAIPIAGFFGVAPGILFAIFIYFHVYLQRLWEGLAELPAIFPDGRPLDKVAYPWLLNGLVRSHFAILRRERPPLSRFQALISIVLAWWTVPFTISLFWLRYLPRHDWVGTGFHLGFLLLAVLCAVWFQRLAKTTLRGQQPAPISFKGNWRSVKLYMEAVKRTWGLIGTGVTIILLASVISDGAINGTKPEQGIKNPAEQEDAKFRRVLILHREIIPMILPYFGARAFAILDEQDVSIKPPNWGLVPDESGIRLVKRAQLTGSDLRHASARRAFLVNADLRGANLRKANLSWAKLQGANLQRAELQGAILDSADLRGASLHLAILEEGAHLRLAEMQGANLQGAILDSADLRGAKLQGAILDSAYLRAANLSDTNLQKADLYGAWLQDVDLSNAELQGANLSEAKGLRADQVHSARNWNLAFYSDDFLKELGLPPDHNETLKKKLAELENKEKEAATKK